MTGWEMIDLHGILSLVSWEPAAFAPEAFEALANLTESKIPGAGNFYRMVMRAWPLKLERMPESPHWLEVDNEYCTPLSICLTEKESVLMRSILLTCARLRREGKLMELSGLAEATEKFPLMIAWQRSDALKCVQKELRRFCRLHGVELTPAPPEDSEARAAAYRKIKRRAERKSKAGGNET